MTPEYQEQEILIVGEDTKSLKPGDRIRLFGVDKKDEWSEVTGVHKTGAIFTTYGMVDGKEVRALVTSGKQVVVLRKKEDHGLQAE